MPTITVGDGSKIYYEVHGQGPRTIVFAHGAAGNHMSWWQQVPHYRENYRCLTFDHRGWGASTDATGMSLSGFAGDLDAILNDAEINDLVLVAQSMGGFTALPFAAAYPDRVRGLLMADTVLGVGDEALLLARTTKTWVARDRALGANAAAADGADIIVMDDGFQNPSLIKDLSIVVVDAGYGFGNCRLLPSGPLRENLSRGLARAHAVIFIEDPVANNVMQIPQGADPPWFAARLAPGQEALRFAEQKIIAFAGIGRPQKFFDTLKSLGARVVMAKAFPDHHSYDADDVMRLVEIASETGSTLVTTEKDRVRLPPEARGMVEVVGVFIEYAEANARERILRPITTSLN